MLVVWWNPEPQRLSDAQTQAWNLSMQRSKHCSFPISCRAAPVHVKRMKKVCGCWFPKLISIMGCGACAVIDSVDYQRTPNNQLIWLLLLRILESVKVPYNSRGYRIQYTCHMPWESFSSVLFGAHLWLEKPCPTKNQKHLAGKVRMLKPYYSFNSCLFGAVWTWRVERLDANSSLGHESRWSAETLSCHSPAK